MATIQVADKPTLDLVDTLVGDRLVSYRESKGKIEEINIDDVSFPVSMLPYPFYKGAAVIYNNEVHILGGSGGSKNHYKWDGSKWESVSTIPIAFTQRSAVVYNNEIHIIGSKYHSEDSEYHAFHYKFDGTSWTCLFEGLSFLGIDSSLVVYNNELHLLGGAIYDSDGYYVAGKKHYTYNSVSNTWTAISTALPYKFRDGSAVVYKDKIHILGGYNEDADVSDEGYTRHCSWNGISWTKETSLLETLPFFGGCAAVWDDEIHVLGTGHYEYNGKMRQYHHRFNGTEWNTSTRIPYDFYQGAVVAFNDLLCIIGGKDSTYYTSVWDKTKWDILEGAMSILPTSSYTNDNRDVILYKNKVYAVYPNAIYAYDNNTDVWTKATDTSSTSVKGGVVVYNNYIHLIGGTSEPNCERHYRWNGSSWSKLSDLPFQFNDGCAAVYSNKIHLIGSSIKKYYGGDNNSTLVTNPLYENHYTWNGSSWSKVSTKPPFGNLTSAVSVVFNNELYVSGTMNSSSSKSNFYKYNGTSWTKLSSMPDYSADSMFVYNNELHLFFDSLHYIYSTSGGTWTKLPNLLHDKDCPVSYNSKIYVFSHNKSYKLSSPNYIPELKEEYEMSSTLENVDKFDSIKLLPNNASKVLCDTNDLEVYQNNTMCTKVDDGYELLDNSDIHIIPKNGDKSKLIYTII